jgi:uncharacterized repeat protein (TIGR01451 family)
MGKVRLKRSFRRALLVACVAALGLVVWTPTSGATPPPEPQVTTVTAIIDHACPSGSNLATVWGYTNTAASAVTITQPDNNDDPLPNGDGDNDDNFFYPGALTRPGQPNTFQPGTFHGVVNTNEAPGLTWTTGANHTSSSAPLNCADVSVAKTQVIDTVTTGSQQQYTVTVTNNGPTTAGGVTLADVLSSSSVSAVTASPSAGSCTVAVPNINCTLGSMAPSATITIGISLTPTAAGSLSDTATASSTTFDPNTANNSASVTTTVAAAGGATGGGVLNTGQQLTVNGTGTTGTVKVQTGTVPLTLAIEPTCPVGATCKSPVLDIEPHATPAGQVLTAVYDTGKPSPFVLIPFVKFFIYKNGVDKPLPFCKPYLKPQPLPDGSACEYFRWMNLQGHAIVYIALGANDPRVHR